MSLSLAPTALSLALLFPRVLNRFLSSPDVGAGVVLPCLEGDAVEDVRKRLKLETNDRVAEQHMSAELGKAKEHLCTGILDHIHSWTHAGV